MTGGIGVDARELSILTQAGLESAVFDIGGGVPTTSDTVQGISAVGNGVGASRVTDLHAKNVTTHEVGPLGGLDIRAGESGGKHETSKGVTTEIGTVGIELSAGVVRQKVDFGLVEHTGNQEVVWGLYKLDTLEGTSGYETSAVTGLGTPGNFGPFRIANGGARLGGCPETEI